MQGGKKTISEADLVENRGEGQRRKILKKKKKEGTTHGFAVKRAGRSARSGIRKDRGDSPRPHGRDRSRPGGRERGGGGAFF